MGEVRIPTSVVVTFISLVAIVAVFYAPKLRFHSGQPTEVLQNSCSQQVTVLEQEIVRLRQALSQKPENAAIARPATNAAAKIVDPIIPIDMSGLLGLHDYYDGISFDIYRCAAPIKHVFPNIDQPAVDRLVEQFRRDLATEMARILGVKEVPETAEWLEMIKPAGATYPEGMALMIRDPRTLEWREAMTAIMSRYMAAPNGLMLLECPGAPATVKLEDFGKERCPGMKRHEIVEAIGMHAVPFGNIKVITHDALVHGLCTKPPGMKSSYAEWLRDERMFTPEWKTFHVDTPEQDHAVFLFDVLYEKLQIFKNQYWMGVITMQNPFDLLSIQDIIFTTKPDLIIETGTANGGSALLWASLMELADIPDGRVITVDISPPTWDSKGLHWGGVAREDPTKHRFWKKHVTFIQSGSLDGPALDQVREAASKAKKVLVLLDSDHSDKHVKGELDAYCPLVTVGSYCIVEDTKMSRWSADGPLSSVFTFMEKHPEFEVDRSRELLYTHHVSGYIRRIK
mmetsp:Transcript_1095/g.2380  ORF Transcript_1095/g.2380 Transcript_1095/m.2380 type:complete len:513 (-) Transcript_1095:676-2214(-)